MFFPHKIVGNEVESITASADAAQLFSQFNWESERIGYWRRTFNKAKETLKADFETREKMK